MVAIAPGSMVTGPDAVGVGGQAGFTSGGFYMGSNLGPVPSSIAAKPVTLPKYPQRATPTNPGPVKLALGKLPSIFALYHG